MKYVNLILIFLYVLMLIALIEIDVFPASIWVFVGLGILAFIIYVVSSYIEKKEKE